MAAKQNFFYLKVRVQLEKEVDCKKIEAIVNELDCEIKSQTKGVKVENTSIEESSITFEFKD